MTNEVEVGSVERVTESFRPLLTSCCNHRATPDAYTCVFVCVPGRSMDGLERSVRLGLVALAVSDMMFCALYLLSWSIPIKGKYSPYDSLFGLYFHVYREVRTQQQKSNSCTRPATTLVAPKSSRTGSLRLSLLSVQSLRKSVSWLLVISEYRRPSPTSDN